jgi:hypothetical protein
VKGNFVFVLLAFALSKPQVTGDVSPGPSLASLNRKNLPIVVTLGGEGSCFASLTYYSLAFLVSTNCAITVPIALKTINSVENDYQLDG